MCRHRGLVSNSGGYNRQYILKKIRHIVKITVFHVFYAVFCVIWNYYMYPDWNLRGYVAETFTVAKVLKFLITNDPFVYAHLWFLFALIYCYLFFCIFKTRDRIPEYFAIIVLLYYWLHLLF